MTSTRLKWLGFATLALIFLVANVVATHQLLTEPYPGHNDFMTPWEASRSFFYDGVDPYSEEASLRIQTNLYGGPAQPDQQPNHFAYPFYTIFFVFPVIHVTYAWASAIWMVILEIALIGSLLLLLNVYAWRPRPLMLAALILMMLFSYPAWRGLVLGQVSHVVIFLQVGAIWALTRSHDSVAGILLAFATFKPQMSVFLVPFLVIYGIYFRRWHFVSAFVAGMIGLVGLSFVLQPDWVNGFIHQLTLYPSYIEVSTPAWVISDWITDIGRPLEIALNVVGLLFMLWTWFSVFVQRHHERIWWALMVTLTMTHLIGLRTATPHFVVFIVPLVFYLKHLAKDHKGWLGGLILAVIFLVTWVHFLVTLGIDKFEHPTMFLPMPLTMIIVLFLTRRLWWQQSPDLHN